MKGKVGAILLIILNIVGLIIFTTTPLISARVRLQGSDINGSYDVLAIP